MGTGNRSTDVSIPYDPQFECCAGIIEALVKAHGESIVLVMVDATIARALKTGQIGEILSMGRIARDLAHEDAERTARRHTLRRVA